jgi:LacI family transcriptional regulator
MTRRTGRRPPRASSLDVARHARVSRTTVSFVLNHAAGKSIPAATRARVLAAARALGYVPDLRARARAMATRRTIGLFVPHTGYVSADPYVHRVIQGMTPVLHGGRFRLVVQSIAGSQGDYAALARRSEVDGVVFMIAQLRAASFPLVVIGTLADRAIPQLDVDNRAAAAAATRYLVGLGHREIGLILHAPPSFSAARDRREGFRAAMAEAGLAVPRAWVRAADLTEEGGYRAMRAILAGRRRPSAVFATSDVVAYGALQALQDGGLGVPDDVSVVGFDDDLLSRYTRPRLTTVHSPAEGLGAEAARLAMALVRGARPGSSPRLEASLVVRESCRPLIDPTRLRRASAGSSTGRSRPA